jgi:hypothetical protein
VSVSQILEPILSILCVSIVDHRHPQKKVKKSKVGLHKNWVKRTCVNAEDDSDDDRQTLIYSANHDYPCSISSGVSVTGSSRPTTQPNSDDECEGGITDDAGEREEHENLTGNAIHAETLKGYYEGRSKALVTGVSIGTTLDFAAHMSPNRSTCWLALSPPLQFPALSSQTQVPTLPPMCGRRKVIFVLVISLITSRATSPQSSHPDSMNSLGRSLPGSN